MMSRKMWNIFCFVALLWQHCYADGYPNSKLEDIEKLGLTCPELERCGNKKDTKINDFLPKSLQTCACDPDCGLYGDCCEDAPKFKRSEMAMECNDVNDFGGVFMVGTCPSSFEEDEHLKKLCENSNIADSSDPIGTLPVTEFVSGITYKNIYCKLCSGISDAIQIWNFKLECPLLPLFNKSNEITEDYILKNLRLEKGSWGLNMELEDGAKFFIDCDINPVPPKELRHKIRQCKPNLVSDCPSFWINTTIHEKCKSFLGPRFTQEGVGYRNIYCAACNDVNVSDLSCSSPEFDDLDIFKFSVKHSFAILMDINEKTGDKVGMVKMCDTGDVYDPFFQICRTLQCLPGYIRRGLTCVPRKFTRRVYRKRISKKKPLVISRQPVVSSTSSINKEFVERNKTNAINRGRNVNSLSYSELIVSKALAMYEAEILRSNESNIVEHVEIITKSDVSTSLNTVSTNIFLQNRESYTTDSYVQNVTLPSEM